MASRAHKRFIEPDVTCSVSFASSYHFYDKRSSNDAPCGLKETDEMMSSASAKSLVHQMPGSTVENKYDAKHTTSCWL